MLGESKKCETCNDFGMLVDTGGHFVRCLCERGKKLPYKLPSAGVGAFKMKAVPKEWFDPKYGTVDLMVRLLRKIRESEEHWGKRGGNAEVDL